MKTIEELNASAKEKYEAVRKELTEISTGIGDLVGAVFDLAYAIGYSHGTIEQHAADITKERENVKGLVDSVDSPVRD